MPPILEVRHVGIDVTPRVTITQRSRNRPDLDLKQGDCIVVEINGTLEIRNIIDIDYDWDYYWDYEILECRGIRIYDRVILPTDYDILNSIDVCQTAPAAGGKKSRRKKSRKRKSRRY
jgi:hypothetical protein